MANEASERPFQEALGVPAQAIAACGRYLKFSELGAVSPDLPYLQMIAGAGAKAWADAMHYTATDGVIRSAIGQLRNSAMSTAAREKGLAWLFGYTCHVVMDCTIHPVINRLVGDYDNHKTEHRQCEMHQDVFIFERLNLTVKLAEQMKSGIAVCAPGGKLDPAIVSLWSEALRVTHPAEFAAAPPDPGRWHSWFTDVVDAIDTRSSLLVAIARHVAPNSGLVYPIAADPKFLEELETPFGTKMHFGQIFEMAKGHVGQVWRAVAKGALGVDNEYEAVLKHCNLDTGQDATGELVFWQGH